MATPSVSTPESKPTRRSLSRMLNNLEDAHKGNVHEYSRGHLNESKLYKQPRAALGISWENAHKPIPSMAPKSARQGAAANVKTMSDTMKNFSLGTSGSVIVKPKSKTTPRREGTKGPVRLQRLVSASSQGSYDRLDDGVLIENMGAAETMVKRSPIPKEPVLWSDYDNATEEQNYRRPFSQSKYKDQNLEQIQHKFIPSHMNAVTKKDQYMRMKDFESDILKKQETREQNIMSGAKAVEHLEQELRHDLDNLQVQGYGPNFHRLQIYSNTFEDLIDDSPTFKYILGTIKKEYDDYISSLLDQQPSRHKLLYDQVEQLNERGTSNPALLSEEQRKLGQLHEDANSLLEENERLRRELEEEKLLHEDLPEIEPESASHQEEVFKEPDLDLADKIEEAHAAILEKLDQIKDLRKTLRNEYVPSTVVTHLEQCIKETEVESQRYQSQKDFFTRSCNETEKDMKEAIGNADTTEKDAKRIWKQVNKSLGDLDSDNGEEEAKWDWYIS